MEPGLVLFSLPFASTSALSSYTCSFSHTFNLMQIVRVPWLNFLFQAPGSFDRRLLLLVYIHTFHDPLGACAAAFCMMDNRSYDASDDGEKEEGP